MINPELVHYRSETGDLIPVRVYERLLSPYTENVVFFGYGEDGEHLAIKFSPKADREWEALQKTTQYGIDSPRPYAIIINNGCSLCRSLYGDKGIIMKKVEGINLYQAEDNSYKMLLGKIIRSMHERIPVIGEEWGEQGYDISYYISLLDKLEIPVKETEVARLLLKGFIDTVEGRNKQINPRFVHHDLHDDQVRLTPSKRLAIIDFEDWIEGNPLDDIAIYLFHNLRTKQPEANFVDFVKGYTGGHRFADDDNSVIGFYLLLTGLQMVDHFSRFTPQDLHYSLRYLDRCTNFIREERLWKIN